MRTEPSQMRENLERWILPIGLVLITVAYAPHLYMRYHEAKWLVIYFLGVVAGALAIMRPKSFTLPAFTPTQAVLLVSAMVVWLALLFLWRPTDFHLPLLDRWTFFILLLFAYRLRVDGKFSLSQLWLPLLSILALVSSLGLYQIAFGAEKAFFLTEIGSFFGYSNNAAEAVALSLVLLWSLERPKFAWAREWQWGVSFLSFFYLVLTRGRSAILAAILGFVVLLALQYREKIWNRRRWLQIGLGILALGAIFVGAQLALGKSFLEILRFQMFFEKSELTTWRGDVWIQTWRMILDRWYGVGTGRFEFAFIPYHSLGKTLSETHIAASPHNEFLRFLAEEGWLLSGVYLFLVGIVFTRFIRIGTAQQKKWILPVSAVFFVQMLVQFPWQNAFPFFLGVLLFAEMLATGWKSRSLAIPKWIRGGRIALFVAFLGLTSVITVARSLENASSVSALNIGCTLMPSNYRLCMEAAQKYMARKEYDKARMLVEAELTREPWNFWAIRHLSIVAIQQKDRIEACFLLWKYNNLFGMRPYGDLYAQYLHNCPEKWRRYFETKKPERYYKRSRGDLLNLLKQRP